MLRVAAFTGGKSIPSARFRIRQYIEPMVNEGVTLNEFAAPLGAYPPVNKFIRPLWGAASLVSRIPDIISSHSYDVSLLQREMISTLLTLEPFTKRPRVLDVDDAIWLNRKGHFALQLASMCDGIICGNSFLAEYFSQVNANITIIPTAVNTDRYKVGKAVNDPIIGWSGTSGGYKYLYAIEAALKTVLDKIPSSRLLIISNQPPSFKTISPNRFEFIQWSPDNEVKAIQRMAVGIMPLKQSSWEQGKCSFKMLTYMACGLPVVVSPVGMNAEVLQHGDIGFGPSTMDEWVDTLLLLLNNPEKRAEFGTRGRQVVNQNYSVNVLAPKTARTLKQFA